MKQKLTTPEAMTKIDEMLHGARKPVLVNEIAEAIGHTREETNNLLVTYGEQRHPPGIRFVNTEEGFAVGIMDGFGGVGLPKKRGVSL